MASRAGIFAILCLAGACSAKDDKSASTAALERHRAKPVQAAASVPGDATGDRIIFTSAVREGIWYQASAYRVRSVVPRASITPTFDLPAIARKEDVNEGYCADLRAPLTPEGKWARARGWRVNAEAIFGGLTLVNVLRAYSYGQAAITCGEIDGRVIVFDHGKPIATIIAGEVAGGTTIQAFGHPEGGGLRLENHHGDAPFGDLFVTGRDIEIRPLPSADTVCNGKWTVPNIFDKPITQARRILAKAGWKPITAPPPIVEIQPDGSLDFQEDEDWTILYRSGVKEAIYCANTNYCGFRYGARGATLYVETEGKLVTLYSADCPGIGA